MIQPTVHIAAAYGTLNEWRIPGELQSALHAIKIDHGEELQSYHVANASTKGDADKENLHQSVNQNAAQQDPHEESSFELIVHRVIAEALERQAQAEERKKQREEMIPPPPSLFQKMMTQYHQEMSGQEPETNGYGRAVRRYERANPPIPNLENGLAVVDLLV
ncbi:MAG: hypothetical protein H7832_06265 [Magnetococcus sp. DMHC-6]